MLKFQKSVGIASIVRDGLKSLTGCHIGFLGNIHVNFRIPYLNGSLGNGHSKKTNIFAVKRK
jgi:hypothetical protein